MKSRLDNKKNIGYLIKRSLVWSSILVACISITFAFRETANAGLFSLVSVLLTGEKVSAKDGQIGSTLTSQNINLLAAAANFDPNPDRNSDIVPVYDGETLVADLAMTNSSIVEEGNNKISTYVVQEGDTVSGVANMFGVSINTVLWANNLTSKSVLRAGQTLVILPITGINYTIKKGDTLASIAKKYGADKEEILVYNDLTMSSKLAVGQSIIIPHAELAAPYSSGSRSSGSGSSGLVSLPGYFSRPLVGGRKTQGIHGRNGVDIAAPAGTPLLAAAPGTVIVSRVNGAWNGGYGNYVVISHPNGTQTLYAHMLTGAVSVGEYVSRGQTIGTVGSTGLSTGPHVHFEIRGAVNPF